MFLYLFSRSKFKKRRIQMIDNRSKAARCSISIYNATRGGKGSCSMRSTSAMKHAKLEGSEKRRDQFLAVFLRHLKTCHIDTNEKLLVIGGSWQDAELLICAGFKDITLSNFQLELEEDAHSNPSVKVTRLAIDAEQVDLPDGSFDCVF